MSALQRPDVPAGPHRDLVDALHDLHHRAGWPSLRRLAAAAGCSHTTVAKTFSSSALPTWGTLELIVEAMDGDAAAIHVLWLEATTPTDVEPPTGSRIAGRRTEVSALRRHLESGSGLLLVAGEAGMGKTTVVVAAAAGVDTFVATGHCLPLSTQVPLLPIADVLRQAYSADDGAWLAEALAGAPPYVADSLGLLLPELDRSGDSRSSSDGGQSRQWLLGAVDIALAGLASVRPFAVLLEDLHWADDATLDLVEHLVTPGSALALVGTWRVDDPATPAEKLAWFTRVRRLAASTTLDLEPLSRQDTSEQLALLTAEPPSAELVERIHRRSQGQPLFTEQLAAQAGEDQPLPRLLGDLLDQRLDGLHDHARAVAVSLAVADRALTDSQLREVTGRTPRALAEGLRQLTDRRLLAGSDHDVKLRHPLLAEAVRRSMVLAESVEAHRTIAFAMSGWAEASAAEVAAHWQSADEPERELEWRILAARQARARFAWAQEAEQWRRVIALWGDDLVTSRHGVSLAEVCCLAAEALDQSNLEDDARSLMEEAAVRLRHCEGLDRARLLTYLGVVRGYADPAAGLLVLEEALAVYRDLPPTVGYVDLLGQVAAIVHTQGLRSPTEPWLARAAEAAARGGFVDRHRTALMWVAWDQVIYDGDPEGWDRIEESRRLVPVGPDPLGDIERAMAHTDLLLKTGAPAMAVRDAAAVGLRASEDWAIESWFAERVRCSVIEAYLNEGRVPPEVEAVRRGTLVDDVSHWPSQVRLRLETLSGDLAAATATFEEFVDLSSMWALHQGDVIYHASECLLWQHEPDRALGHLTVMLEQTLPTELALFHGGLLSRAARAVGDLDRPSPDRRRVLDLRAAAHVDPFDPHRGPGDTYAHGLTWDAEVARFDETETVDLWARAAAEWDRITRPHDAAYCRWRAARVALRTGQGTVASRLLKRAATDAREHVPLRRAIAATAAGAR